MKIEHTQDENNDTGQGLRKFISSRGRVLGAALCLALFLAGAPLAAWYYFVTSGGERAQWTWNSTCNPNARPIQLFVDSDTPAAYQEEINGVSATGTNIIDNWNNPQGKAINLFNTAVDNNATMSVSYINSFLNNPVKNRVIIVYDSDGSIFNALGADPTRVLGLGVPMPYFLDLKDRNICSGIVFMNGWLISRGTSAVNEFKKTLLHELGHVLGFAHNIAGGNGNTLGIKTNPALWPVMFPFADLNSPANLTSDDQAGAYSVYGP